MVPIGSSRKFITAEELSRYFDIPLSTLYALTKSGKIRGVKIGKQWRYSVEYIERAFVCPPATHSVEDSPPSGKPERRSPARLNCEIPFEICILLDRKGRPKVQGVLANLGEGGALFLHKRYGLPIENGDPVRLTGCLPGMSKDSVEIEGRIVHWTDGEEAKMGIKFRNLSPEQRRAIASYVA